MILCLGLTLCAAGVLGNSVYAESPETPYKDGNLAFWEELAFWETIKDSRDPSEFEAYLVSYPDGRFARLAEIRIKALKGTDAPESAGESAAPAVKSGAPPEEITTSSDDDAVSVAEGADTSAMSPGSRFQDCDDCPLMVVVPAGRHLMGSDRHRPDEKPRHAVSFARAFAIGAYEVTVREWDACLREGGCSFTPKSGGDGSLPIGNLSWDDAQEYVSWLSEKTGKDYRLPTEAEWEYTASGGRTSAFWWGNKVGRGKANCSDCGSAWDGKAPAPVGSFEPNPFGLYDVHGNLWEWTMDCLNRSYKGAPTDGSAWLRGDCLARVLRGGSWKLGSDYMRTSRRNHYDRDVRYYLHGFRVARPLP